MADVSPELMFEVMKSIQARLAQVDGKIDELKQEMQAMRTSQTGIRHEITSVFPGDFERSCHPSPSRRSLGPH